MGKTIKTLGRSFEEFVLDSVFTEPQVHKVAEQGPSEVGLAEDALQKTYRSKYESTDDLRDEPICL